MIWICRPFVQLASHCRWSSCRVDRTDRLRSHTKQQHLLGRIFRPVRGQAESSFPFKGHVCGFNHCVLTEIFLHRATRVIPTLAEGCLATSTLPLASSALSLQLPLYTLFTQLSGGALPLYGFFFH